jgi:hypothetical protein
MNEIELRFDFLTQTTVRLETALPGRNLYKPAGFVRHPAVRFCEIPRAQQFKNMIFFDLMPCRLVYKVDMYQSFHLQIVRVAMNRHSIL